MKLKELKRDVDSLGHVNKTINSFKKTWVKHLKPNSNSHLPFLQNLDDDTKKQVNNNLENYRKIMAELNNVQFTQEKLSTLAQSLIDLKLTSFNGDNMKPRIIMNKFIHDDFMNLKTIVDEVNQFEFNLKNLNEIYHQTNHLITNNLPLEHSVTFMDSSHKNHLNTMGVICDRQKTLLKHMGQEFIHLTRNIKKIPGRK